MAFGLDRTITRIPSLDGSTGWLNSQPLTPAELRGRVVAVQFCTYTCINWLRTLPYFRAWAERYGERGLVAIGVHTPEFPFEHDIDNVRRAAEAMRIGYPLALDNDYAVWDAFANNYWPALYLVDSDGAIRFHHFGEGRYDDSEQAIQELLGLDEKLVSIVGSGIEAPADWDDLDSPETYLGFRQGERFASPGGPAADERREYALPESLGSNRWALAGQWTIGRDGIRLDEAGGRLAYRFQARDLHLVLAPPESDVPVRFRVLVDGEAPGTSHGDDIDEQGNGTLSEPRLYQLIRQQGPIEDRTFEITFLEPGAQAYVFTFG